MPHTYTVTVTIEGVTGENEDEAIAAVYDGLAHLSYAIQLDKVEQEDDTPVLGRGW